MPNWCFTQYEITGKKEEVEALYNKMKELQEMENPLHPNGFGTKWLGNLVKAYEGNWEEIRCRGSWDDLEYGNNILTFYTETAWMPQTETFDFLKTKLPSLAICYRAEEPGMEIYITNDAEGVAFPERYYVDACFDGEYEAEYFIEKSSVFEWLSEKTSTKIESMEDVEKWNQSYEDDEEASEENFICIHEFELVD